MQIALGRAWVIVEGDARGHNINQGKATMSDVINQLEYMVKLAGIEHVAIGSDFDGDIDPAEGLEDASRLPALAAELRRRKWRNDDILKVFSLNALRVLSYRPRKVTAAITSP